MAQPTSSVPESFKTYLYTSYGATEKELKLREDFPQTPLELLQVRIKVHSASVNPVDWKLVEFGGKYLPVSPTEDKPFRIGFDAAGTVVELGSDVNDFAVGDAVYVMTPFTAFGAFGEYLAVDTQFVAPKPKNLDFDRAATVPLAGLTSYQALVTQANVQQGEHVLILGGSSGTGLFAVQIAKALGAHVTTTTSFRNAEFVKALGADQVIDYTSEKWVDVLDSHSVDVLYDCGFEPASWNDDAQRVLQKGTGRFVTLQDTPNPIESTIGATHTRVRVHPSAADLKKLTQLIEAGKVVTTIDSVFPFGDLLGAIARVKSSRARGKVVVQIAKAAKVLF